MSSPRFPVTDDHIHIDPVNGRGVEAAKDFQRAGGTHLFLVSKPSWSLGVHPSAGSDYKQVFEETLRVADLIRETGLIVFPVLGVHPAEVSRLTECMSLDEAVRVMEEGINYAARYVDEGCAVALKSGRPHYDVDEAVMEASNRVLTRALIRTRECGCALQIHAETGPCADIADMAKEIGVPVERVVKHYGSPETPLHPSLIAKHDAIPALAKECRVFTMESDYMDENSRPGAVIGPKSVPRFTNKLLISGQITEDDCFRIHSSNVERIYGVTIDLP